MVVFSALGRAVLCPLMASDIHEPPAVPRGLLILVLSKLYLVTRGALVPEMVALDRATARPGTPVRPRRSADGTGPGATAGAAGPARRRLGAPAGYAALNARLTLLAPLAGFVASVPGVILLEAGRGARGAASSTSSSSSAAAVAGSPAPGRRAAPAAAGRAAAARPTRPRPGGADGRRPRSQPDAGAGDGPGRRRTWPGLQPSPTPRCCSA